MFVVRIDCVLVQLSTKRMRLKRIVWNGIATVSSPMAALLGNAARRGADCAREHTYLVCHIVAYYVAKRSTPGYARLPLAQVLVLGIDAASAFGIPGGCNPHSVRRACAPLARAVPPAQISNSPSQRPSYLSA